MVRWCLLGILLAGCQSAPPPVATASATAVQPEVVSTPGVVAATPMAAATPAPSAPVAEPTIDVNAAVRATAQFVHLGMTNQARVDQLVAHLNAAGKNQLWVTWEVYPASTGTFEVTYVIEPLSNLTSGKKPTVGKRGSPFDRPRRVHNNGVYLEWLYDANKKTCVARNDRTRALMEIKPVLDGLEAALPPAWQTATASPATVEAAAPVVIPTVAPSVETGSSEPIQFTGFMGDGASRRAVLTQAGETFAVGPGDKVGAYKVKSVAEDELELGQGEDTVRLMPGQVWTP